MGRFEKQPENPRVRGELSRAAENALWAVVEDLENLQQTVLRTWQEDVKRLQAEKDRLIDDIQTLQEEKEHLQQVRQITEQQVLIRQLAEVLAKHISSQLQSTLQSVATQAIEGNSSERATLKSAEVGNKIVGEINEKVEHMFGSLDDTVTITFNSLQQELKNYQSNLSQQLSRMHSQQQEGEEILAEFVTRLQGKLEKTIEETARKAATAALPTVLQLSEPEKKSSSEKSPPVGEVAKIVVEPISVIPKESSESQAKPESAAALLPRRENVAEPISVIPKESSESQVKPESAATLPQPKEKASEPISIVNRDFSQNKTVSPPATPTIPSQEGTQPPPKVNAAQPTESISVVSKDLSNSKPISPPATTPTPQQGGKSLPKRNTTEPISVLNRDLSKSKTTLEPPTAPAPRQGATPSRSSSRSSQGLSTIQTGFLLVVLSTVLMSLYNVAIKIIFHEGSQILGVLDVERLLPPTLGNILLVLTIRFMVVVPLMILLAPILHPRVWQDLQNLADSVRGNPTSTNVATQRTLLLSVVSGCFLFLSQVLIYTAIGQVSTGMAIALFFVYPIVTSLLSWLLFRDRPNLFGGGAIAAICCGELLVLAGSVGTEIANTSLGTTTAIISGVAFACYVFLTRICADKLHPVSFTLINFSTMLLLSFICLMLPLPSDWNLQVNPSKMLELILSAFILGVLTLSSYLFNIFGIRNLGASRSAIIGSSVPVLTVIFAGLLIQENLDIVQIIGVLLVTFGAAAFSFEKMRNQQVKSSSSTN
jgi:drug/metabolite transporter (DMT)-like permease